LPKSGAGAEFCENAEFEVDEAFWGILGTKTLSDEISDFPQMGYLQQK